MPSTHEQIQTMLHLHALDAHAPAVLAAAREAVELVPVEPCEPKPDELVSRLGGAPDLPPGTPWPSVDGDPLEFVAQIRLDELVGFPAAKVLPSTGLLSLFFIDEIDGEIIDDPANTRAFFFPDLNALQRATPPKPPLSPSIAMACRPTLTIPHAEHKAWAGADINALSEFLEAFANSRAIDPTYSHTAFADDFDTSEMPPHRPMHQLLGWAGSAQFTNPCAEICLPKKNPGQGVEVLAVIDTFAGRMWGDLGRVYFLVPEEDLARGELSRCEAFVIGS